MELSSRRHFLTIVSGIGICGCLGCRTVPITDRRQLLLIPEQKEIVLGTEAYQEALLNAQLSTDPRLTQMVERVGRRIAAVADKPEYPWEFNLIADPTPNAFCLPGGKVAIYEGMLAICQDEAGLAAVLGHEIGHALARHGGERMSQNVVADQSRMMVERITGSQTPGRQELLLMAYGVGTQYGVLLPFSRKHELEADKIGTLLMAQAGYDPSAAPRIWRRFAELNDGGQNVEFASTHPSDARRVEELNQILDQASDQYRSARVRLGLGESI